MKHLANRFCFLTFLGMLGVFDKYTLAIIHKSMNIMTSCPINTCMAKKEVMNHWERALFQDIITCEGNE